MEGNRQPLAVSSEVRATEREIDDQHRRNLLVRQIVRQKFAGLTALLARPPVAGAVGQLCPVAAHVGVFGGMRGKGIPRLGCLAVRGRGRRRGL